MRLEIETCNRRDSQAIPMSCKALQGHGDALLYPLANKTLSQGVREAVGTGLQMGA